MIRSNLHTHSVFCDGKDTPKDIVKEAIKKGFKSIGFSSHMASGYTFDASAMKEEKVDEYFNTISNLKSKFKGKIEIYTGLELEAVIVGDKRPKIDKRLDYTIGSSHFVRKDGHHYAIDFTPESWKETVETFGGIKKVLLSYFEDIISFSHDTPYDILGHFDLYTKFNERYPIFSEDEKWYQDMAINALEEIVKNNKIIEVNTGAISRGWRTTPYPSLFLLKRLKELNAPIIVSSDSHAKETIDFYFDETRNILYSLGFKEQMELTKEGFNSVPL